MKSFLMVFIAFFSTISLHGVSLKKAIVVGATSGMGRDIAKRLSNDGYVVGLVGRRVELLQSLQQELKRSSYIKQIDVTASNARQLLVELIEEMQGLDLIVISISPYLDNRNDNDSEAHWRKIERQLDVCAKGFIAMADIAFSYFIKQKRGHLVGISSTSGLRGCSGAPAYSGAKACISTYMEGVRNYMARHHLPVFVSDVVAGYVAVEHSPLGEDPAAYWEITTEQAGKSIFDGIKKKKKIIYVPSKIEIIAFLLRNLPDWVYNNPYYPWK